MFLGGVNMSEGDAAQFQLSLDIHVGHSCAKTMKLSERETNVCATHQQ